jgi:hypothetical protein
VGGFTLWAGGGLGEECSKTELRLEKAAVACRSNGLKLIIRGERNNSEMYREDGPKVMTM